MAQPIRARTVWPGWCASITERRLAALVALVLSPAQALAQTLPPIAPDADAALGALIPDSAVADPATWALDTEAARHPPDPRSLPPVAWPVTGPPPDALPVPIPGLTIGWPDSFAVPPITLLTADADATPAQASPPTAGAARDVALPRGGWRGAAGDGARVWQAAPGITVAIAATAAVPEIQDIVHRFGALSSLRALARGDDNLAQVSRRAHDDAVLLQQIMQLYGYYDAQVSPDLLALLPGADPLHNAGAVRFDVQPGTRYRLTAIDLGDLATSLERDAKKWEPVFRNKSRENNDSRAECDSISSHSALDHAALLGAFALKPGDAANSEAIVAARDRLEAMLGTSGYTFARLGQPALVVDHATAGADLTVPLTTGGTYVFGQITSSLPRFLNARHLQRIARMRPGQRYDQRLVDDFRQAVLTTGIVGGVTITPREAVAPTATTPGVADLDVVLTKGPEHTVAGQVGLSSGQGFEVDASWEDRNLFPPEGMVRLRGVLGTRQQLAGATFRRSNFMARDQAFSLNLYAQALITDAYDAHTLSAIASLDKTSTLLFQKKWAYSAGLQVIATRQLAAGSPTGTPFTTYFIGALPLKLAFDGSNNLLDPTRGARIALAASPAISIQGGPRSSYITTQFEISGYQPVSSQVVLAARVRVAAINGTSIANIAPSQRLYAGGSASIRGYGYQAVGPRDAANNPTGGRSLSEFSLEARFKTGLFDGALSVVPFLDGGMVGTTPTPTMRGAKFGAGFGIRYQTNFGPIRFDIGTPLNRAAGDSRIAVAIALGQAF